MSFVFDHKLHFVPTANIKQAAHLEQSTPYYVLSGLMRALIALIVPPNRYGQIDIEEFADAMPAEVSEAGGVGHISIQGKRWRYTPQSET